MRQISIPLLFLFLQGLALISSDESLTESTSLGIRYYLSSDQERSTETAHELPFSTGVSFLLDSQPLSRLEFRAEILADLEQVRAAELWLRYESPSAYWKLGSFENRILMEDRILPENRIFYSPGRIRRRLEYMGWYGEHDTGLEWSNRGHHAAGRVEAAGHLFIDYVSHELSGTLALILPGDEPDAFGGIGIAVFPYALSREIFPHNHAYSEELYTILTLFRGDLSHRSPVVYGLALSAGTNRTEASGITDYPSGEEGRWFGGPDVMIGVPVRLGGVIWTPALNASWLSFDWKQPEAYGLELRLGNRIAWRDMLFLHLEFGGSYSSSYDRFTREDLTKDWDIIGAAALRFHY